MQVFFILFSVHFAVYQYINSKCLYRTHVKLFTQTNNDALFTRIGTKCPHCGSRRTKRVAQSTIYE